MLLLAGLAVVLAGLAPRVMARFTVFRRCPGPALLLWQAVSLAAVAAALLVAPVAWWTLTDREPVLLTLAVLLTTGMLVLVLRSGHRVGTGLRERRRRHRDLVDLLGTPDAPAQRTQTLAQLPGLRVVDHPSPTAYCLPGLDHRIVLSSGILDRLAPDEIDAVLAHERAHLGARHDLVLELFTVLHCAVPSPLRFEVALAETRLLVEALADRSAIRHVGARPLARALVALHGGAHPDAALGAGSDTQLTRTRLELIADAATPRRAQAVAMVTFAAGVTLAPWILVALSL